MSASSLRRNFLRAVQNGNVYILHLELDLLALSVGVRHTFQTLLHLGL